MWTNRQTTAWEATPTISRQPGRIYTNKEDRSRKLENTPVASERMNKMVRISSHEEQLDDLPQENATECGHEETMDIQV